MPPRAYQQCVRCVMDTSDPEIRFDPAGVCNHCEGYLRKMDALVASGRAGPVHLEQIVAQLKRRGRGKPYDAVLGISGGVDSCYLALRLAEFGVRTLLVHMDNGWDSPQAVRNIANVVAKVGFDYESRVLDWDEFRDIQLAFLRASVVEAETPTDMAIPAVLYAATSAHGVRHIVSASNEASEGILPRLWHYNAKDTRYFRAVCRQYSERSLKNFPMMGLGLEFYYKFVREISSVYLLNYMNYDRSAALQHLREHLDWQDYGGKHHESEFTKFVQTYLLPRKFGIDYRRATLSTQICCNKVTREDALEQLARPPYDPDGVERQKAYVARKLNLSGDELEEILSLPGRFYSSYPNNERLINRTYALYEWMRKRRESKGVC